MKKKKKPVITKKMQEVAFHILSRFEFVNDMSDFVDVFKEMQDYYGLLDDPFTSTVCTPAMYERLLDEYERQLRENIYGYDD